MALSPRAFPPRKRRPSAGSFISPKFSDHTLVQSLLLLTSEIIAFSPFQFVMRRNSASAIRKSKLLQVFFEEIVRSSVIAFSHSALICFEEMYIVLQRLKTLIEDCSNGSKMWLLMQNESISNNFHDINLNLSTLLDILPVREMDLNDDVKELVNLIARQCSETKAFLDPGDDDLKRDVLKVLDGIKREIVPDHSKLADIFGKLGIRNSSGCREELEILQDEVQNQIDQKSKSDLIALIGLVRYAKCVFFEASTPSPSMSDSRRCKQSSLSASDMVSPADFRCPISLELMRDPVVVATGQTYDRESIKLWIDSGHNTCPKTGQTLAHMDLITNCALKNLIAMWCRQQRIPYETAGNDGGFNDNGAVITNKAALEATKMTASFLVNKLSVSQTLDAANAVIYEFRMLAKTDSDSRACIAEAGAIPLLVRFLGSDVGTQSPNLQVNAVTTILNLSILEANKSRIMDTDGALNGVIEVLRSGATWEAKANSAATIYSLSGVHSYKKRLGKKTRVIRGLVDLAKGGPVACRRDAMVAILNLATDRETVGRMVEGGVVEMTLEVMEELPEEATAVLEVAVRRGGLAAVAAAFKGIKKLGVILREGSEIARESAAATLVTICRKGGSDMVAELAALPGIERCIWELLATGTGRSRRKAANLLKALRRWAAGIEEGASLSANVGSSITVV